MPTNMRETPAKATKNNAKQAVDDVVRAVVMSLKRLGNRRNREGMARYGIPSDNAFGVSMANIQVLARRLGRNHALAAKLWDTGLYEARMLTAYVDEPARVTSAQMDRWCRDFDNWAICDTLCFALFDRTPHAWAKVAKWAGHRSEFVKRSAFALLWSLTVHDKVANDEPFVQACSSSSAQPPTNGTSSRRPSIWPCVRSESAITRSMLRQCQWPGDSRPQLMPRRDG
jgi:3-methyladenine DNA glycosylase AlkD